MMKAILFIIFFVMTFVFITPACGWDYKGHVVIAQMAYDQLSTLDQEKADRSAFLVFDKLPILQQNELNKHYPDASFFAKVSLLPDVWHTWRLATVFNNNHVRVPPDLLPFSRETTQKWHFINQPYPASSKNPCPSLRSHNVVWAINTMENSYKSTDDPNVKALDMVFIEHYIADANQPLHVLNNITNGCKGDEGGNNFCLKVDIEGNCIKNLHGLWDGGVGYLTTHEDIKSIISYLEKAYPKSQFKDALQDNNAKDWVTSEYHYADFIYDLPEYKRPPAYYYYNGQLLAKQQLALASYRLSNEMHLLLKE